MKAPLPELRKRLLRISEAEPQLHRRPAPPALAPQPPRNALFQDLQDGRRRSFGWLADQQMNVLGHDHVSDQREVKTAPHLAKDLYERVSRTNRAEQRQAAVATACDEMQVLLPVVAPQSFGHRKNQKPHPCKNRKDGAPPPSYHSPRNYRSGILSSTSLRRSKEGKEVWATRPSPKCYYALRKADRCNNCRTARRGAGQTVRRLWSS